MTNIVASEIIMSTSVLTHRAPFFTKPLLLTTSVASHSIVTGFNRQKWIMLKSVEGSISVRILLHREYQSSYGVDVVLCAPLLHVSSSHWT